MMLGIRRGWAVLAGCLVAHGAAAAVVVEDLYRAQTIVTGTEEPERSRGLRNCLVEVVAKLTGDAALARGERIQPLLTQVHRYVQTFEYEDRMKGIPLHDEQGTRQRPHYLRVRFKAQPLKAALHERGIALWPARRPLVAVWLGVRTAVGDYVVYAQGSDGYGQREVLLESAGRQGVPVWLPQRSAATQAVGFAAVAADDARSLAALSPEADALLLGTLDIDAQGYWESRWTLHRDQRSPQRWGQRGVTFDTAIRDGVQRSALLLSDPSAPQRWQAGQK